MKIIRKGKNTYHNKREVYIDKSTYTSRNTLCASRGDLAVRSAASLGIIVSAGWIANVSRRHILLGTTGILRKERLIASYV